MAVPTMASKSNSTFKYAAWTYFAHFGNVILLDGLSEKGSLGSVSEIRKLSSENSLWLTSRHRLPAFWPVILACSFDPTLSGVEQMTERYPTQMQKLVKAHHLGRNCGRTLLCLGVDTECKATGATGRWVASRAVVRPSMGRYSNPEIILHLSGFHRAVKECILGTDFWRIRKRLYGSLCQVRSSSSSEARRMKRQPASV